MTANYYLVISANTLPLTGPVHKKDVMKASVMLQHDKEFACLLAFDVKVERDAQETADSLGVSVEF